MIPSTPSLAADGTPTLLLLVVGVVVAALLVAAFWYGSRRAARREDPGARPVDQNPQAAARQDSWQEPDAGPAHDDR
ncbi:MULTISPECIES: DUF6479 family protein [Streptomyces]|uniref:DUF6479 family protein n=1 Tax=Streptomyces TaxID=1883 RepID=UPI000F775756|nr:MULTISPECIES: DUF6479 family protein [Streptomyces]RST04286.1 hypothetical protein EF910_17165 [Streptomyces sp. WAC07149]GLX23292.1 hypothetical protein Slala01_69360 [Streptomyces lavendulae subsp. lavendulae]GLX30755.1 hypothetical protein Slala02_65750 [Streptomyces lavendulae subsp. lavendulae]